MLFSTPTQSAGSQPLRTLLQETRWRNASQYLLLIPNPDYQLVNTAIREGPGTGTAQRRRTPPSIF